MGNGRISAKQSEILEYIKEQILTKGYPPAERRIGYEYIPLGRLRHWKRTDT